MYKKHAVLLVCIFFYFIPSICNAESLKVVFLNPGYPDQNATGSFWANVSQFTQAAANDLNIELVTLYGHRNHVLIKSLAKELVSLEPDYIVLVNEQNTGAHLVKAIAPYHIPIFFLLNSLNDKELLTLSTREKSMIIGSLIPNNFNVGEKLAKDLMAVHNASKQNKTVAKVLALQGDYTTQAAKERTAGFNSALVESPQHIVIDSTVANWSKQQAYQKVKGLLKRSRIDIIWAANDAMAFGAKRAIQTSNISYPIVVGGINWDIDERDEKIDISYGGHVVLGAYAMVMLCDMHDGLLPVMARTKTIDIFKSNQSHLYPIFTKHLVDNKTEDYDFTIFTQKHINTQIFSLEALTSTFK